MSPTEITELNDIRRELENALMRVNRMLTGKSGARLMLVSYPDHLKINVIKCLRALTGLGLKEAKQMSEVPQNLFHAVEVLTVPCASHGWASKEQVMKTEDYQQLIGYAIVRWE